METQHSGWAIKLGDGGGLVKGFGNGGIPVGTGNLNRVSIFKREEDADSLVEILMANRIEAKKVYVYWDGKEYHV